MTSHECMYNKKKRWQCLDQNYISLGVRGGVVNELMVGVVAIGGVVSELTLVTRDGVSNTISVKKNVLHF